MRIARGLPRPSEKLHPSELAAIDRRACLDETRGRISIATGVTIGAYAVVRGPLAIGVDAQIEAHAIVGGSPGKRGASAMGAIVVGARARIGAGAIVESATTARGVTIGDDAWVMPRAYVGHDAHVGDRATIGPGATIGGFCFVDDDAFVGLGAALHPRSTLGAWAHVGMRATVTRDVPPAAIVIGTPARFRRTNATGLQRSNHTVDDIAALDRWVTALVDRAPFASPPQRFAVFCDRFAVESRRDLVTRAGDRDRCRADLRRRPEETSSGGATKAQ